MNFKSNKNMVFSNRSDMNYNDDKTKSVRIPINENNPYINTEIDQNQEQNISNYQEQIAQIFGNNQNQNLYSENMPTNKTTIPMTINENHKINFQEPQENLQGENNTLEIEESEEDLSTQELSRKKQFRRHKQIKEQQMNKQQKINQSIEQNATQKPIPDINYQNVNRQPQLNNYPNGFVQVPNFVQAQMNYPNNNQNVQGMSHQNIAQPSMHNFQNKSFQQPIANNYQGIQDFQNKSFQQQQQQPIANNYQGIQDFQQQPIVNSNQGIQDFQNKSFQQQQPIVNSNQGIQDFQNKSFQQQQQQPIANNFQDLEKPILEIKQKANQEWMKNFVKKISQDWYETKGRMTELNQNQELNKKDSQNSNMLLNQNQNNLQQPNYNNVNKQSQPQFNYGNFAQASQVLAPQSLNNFQKQNFGNSQIPFKNQQQVDYQNNYSQVTPYAVQAQPNFVQVSQPVQPQFNYGNFAPTEQVMNYPNNFAQVKESTPLNQYQNIKNQEIYKNNYSQVTPYAVQAQPNFVQVSQPVQPQFNYGNFAQEPQISTPQISTPQISTSQISTSQISTPQISTPQMYAPQAPEINNYSNSTEKVEEPIQSTSNFDVYQDQLPSFDQSTISHDENKCLHHKEVAQQPAHSCRNVQVATPQVIPTPQLVQVPQIVQQLVPFPITTPSTNVRMCNKQKDVKTQEKCDSNTNCSIKASSKEKEEVNNIDETKLNKNSMKTCNCDSHNLDTQDSFCDCSNHSHQSSSLPVNQYPIQPLLSQTFVQQPMTQSNCDQSYRMGGSCDHSHNGHYNNHYNGSKSMRRNTRFDNLEMFETGMMSEEARIKLNNLNNLLSLNGISYDDYFKIKKEIFLKDIS